MWHMTVTGTVVTSLGYGAFYELFTTVKIISVSFQMESTSGIYTSPIAYYDQQQSSNNSIKGSMPLHDSNFRNQDWESYDENLIPARKSKVLFKIINCQLFSCLAVTHWVST